MLNKNKIRVVVVSDPSNLSGLPKYGYVHIYGEGSSALVAYLMTQRTKACALINLILLSLYTYFLHITFCQSVHTHHKQNTCQFCVFTIYTNILFNKKNCVPQFNLLAISLASTCTTRLTTILNACFQIGQPFLDSLSST